MAIPAVPKNIRTNKKQVDLSFTICIPEVKTQKKWHSHCRKFIQKAMYKLNLHRLLLLYKFSISLCWACLYCCFCRLLAKNRTSRPATTASTTTTMTAMIPPDRFFMVKVGAFSST